MKFSTLHSESLIYITSTRNEVIRKPKHLNKNSSNLSGKWIYLKCLKFTVRLKKSTDMAEIGSSTLQKHVEIETDLQSSNHTLDSLPNLQSNIIITSFDFSSTPVEPGMSVVYISIDLILVKS